MNFDNYHSKVATLKVQNFQNPERNRDPERYLFESIQMTQEMILMLALGVIFIGGSFGGLTGVSSRPGM